MEVPETRCAKVGDVHIAYQVVGRGERDLVLVPGIFTNVEYQWEEPSFARFLRRLASFSRLILFDPRGTGLSDRAPELPTLEQQMDDVNAVVDAVGSERAALFGLSQGGPMAALYAATYPARTAALILYGTYPTVREDTEFSPGRSAEWLEEYGRTLDERWGQGAYLPNLAPSRGGDELFKSWWARFERFSSAPGNALAFFRMNAQIDIRAVLPTIAVPTLVLHRRDDAFRPPATSRYIAERVPGARYIELDGVDDLPFVGDADALLDDVEEFLTGVRRGPEPDRVLATVLFTDIVGSTERAGGRWFDGARSWDPEGFLAMVERGWGGPVFWDALAPSLADHDGARETWARFLRLSLSPTTAVAMMRVALEADLVPLLRSIRVPTLALCRTGDRFVDPEHSRIIAEGIPGARLVELPGNDSAWWLGDTDAILDEIQEFLTGVRPVRETDRIVATVLFTDVVGSTEKAAELGDRSWRSLLDRHNTVVRRELARHRGREIKTVGDGFLATFDGPARAIRCATAVRERVESLGIDLRAGLHTGEVELLEGDVGGIGVHIGARVAAMAGPGEVLVSSTVKDLVVGSGIEFDDRGTHALKGVPGEWRLFAVSSA